MNLTFLYVWVVGWGYEKSLTCGTNYTKILFWVARNGTQKMSQSADPVSDVYMNNCKVVRVRRTASG